MADRDYNPADVLDTYRIDGSMIRTKSRVLVEDLLDKFYMRMQDSTLANGTLIEIAKILIELGDLKPKANAPTGPTAPAMSITINIPNQNGGEPINITASSQPVTPSDTPDDLASEVLDLPVFAERLADALTADDLPEDVASVMDQLDLGPVPLRVPDFSLNQDLIGPTR